MRGLFLAAVVGALVLVFAGVPSATRAASSAGAESPCRRLQAVFYGASEWVRLAQKLSADASPCADYYISVPPLAADKTKPRPNQASQIRALGPRFHAMAEIHWDGWSTWVKAVPDRTWFEAGVEARHRMQDAGYAVSLGDTWALNELKPSVREDEGTARLDAREFVRGLWTGDGAASQGLVFVFNVQQTTRDTSQYKAALEGWLQDADFWNDMRRYVRFWGQEVYADSRNWGVAGAGPATRTDYLNDYLQHAQLIAKAGPDTAAAARAFLEAAYSPIASAAWQHDVLPGNLGFGNTMISSLQMQNFVSAQAYAMRHFGNPRGDEDRFGFAWAPKRPTTMPLADFTTRTGEILDRLASALHLSDQPGSDPGIGACGALLEWCGTDVDGAWLNDAWKIFGTWTAPAARDSDVVTDEDIPVDLQLDASDADGDPLAFAVVETPLHGSLTALDGGNRYRYTPDQGYVGADSFTFRANDGFMSSRAATVSISVRHVNHAPLSQDGSAVVSEDGAVDVTLGSSDRDGDALTFTIVDQPAHGGLSGTPPTLTYSPAPDFNGADSLTFRVGDGAAQSQLATFSLAVTPVNDAPTVELEAVGTVDEGGAPVELAAHALDVDGDALSYEWASDVGTLAPNGPTAGFAADDGPASAQVTVTASDGHGGSAGASRQIEVRNVAPIVDAGADLSHVWGLPVALEGTARDPSAADTRAGLGETWTFGEGGPAAAGPAASHVYDVPGSYTATLAAADKDGAMSSDAAAVTIRPRLAEVRYDGPSALLASAATVSARLGDGADASTARLDGHTVTFTLGLQGCSGTTDASGLASCTIDAASQPLGPASVTATFAGDDLYSSSFATADVVLYALPFGGAFVVGDGSTGGAVTFWSPEWWKANPLTGGARPASFKGFANGAGAPSCGLTWNARPGHSGAPAVAPGFMPVIVAGSVTKSGSTISGDTVHVVVVRTDAFDPAGTGRGAVVATVC